MGSRGGRTPLAPPHAHLCARAFLSYGDHWTVSGPAHPSGACGAWLCQIGVISTAFESNVKTFWGGGGNITMYCTCLEPMRQVAVAKDNVCGLII